VRRKRNLIWTKDPRPSLSGVQTTLATKKYIECLQKNDRTLSPKSWCTPTRSPL